MSGKQTCRPKTSKEKSIGIKQSLASFEKRMDLPKYEGVGAHFPQ